MTKKRTILITLISIGIVVAVNQSNGSNTTRLISVLIEIRRSSILHIWLKTRTASQEVPARIRIRHPSMDNVTVAKTDQHVEFEFHELSLQLEGPAKLEWTSADTHVSYIYVYEPENVLTRGIRPAFIANAARFPDVREGYHFRPPLGWMNDPNGFSKFGNAATPMCLYAMANWRFVGVLHRDSRLNTSVVECAALLPLTRRHNGGIGGTLWVLLYGQLDALDPRTGRRNMSPALVGTFDGMHFRALFEQELDFGTGSYAFQGFYDESLDKTLMIGWLANWHDYDGETKTDFPTSMTVPRQILISSDGTALLTPPIDLSQLRAQRLDDGHLLQTGQTVPLPSGTAEIRLVVRQELLQLHAATVQLEADHPKAMANWRFVGVLHRDSRLNTSVVECAALLPLTRRHNGGIAGTLWVLLYGQLDALDPRTGRRNMSPALVGTFDGMHFRALFEQELDFGTGSYAFQGFYDESLDKTLMIGWLANWHDYDGETKADFPTSMTVPRQILISSDGAALLTPPIDLSQLRAQRLDDGHLLQTGQTVPLPSGTAEIRLVVRQELLQLHAATVQLEADHPKGLEIVPGTMRSPPERLIALGARPTELHIFLDTGSIEVFADGGRWVGTHRLDGFDRFTAIRLRGELSAVVNSEVWALNGAEFRGRLGQQ
uniref:beta-fructofuranosidase n=1 Tax=Globodera pallida TaxID=36090 RepID=A0A183CDW3_GLOPA